MRDPNSTHFTANHPGRMALAARRSVRLNLVTMCFLLDVCLDGSRGSWLSSEPMTSLHDHLDDLLR